MRQEEWEYWDKEAKDKETRDNVWKRAAIIQRIFKLEWLYHRILEIGTGGGTIAGVLHYIYLNNIEYRGTDVSKVYCERAREFLKLNMTHTDILNLPTIKDGFTRVIALDSLEHINPEDRDQGYKHLGDVLAEDCTMVINMPMNETGHDLRFDHDFSAKDIVRLGELARMELASFDVYSIDVPSGKAHYGWAVLQRGLG
jgi:cyclopropane fatty-acyl-phospholipid synthase-like methyltransferase